MINRKHAPFMLLVFVALLTGVWAGLLRSGWQVPHLHDNFALAHGVLMIGGFLGTLINLERAVALYGFLKDGAWRYLPYLAPLLSAIGAVALVVDLSLAAILITLSSLGMVLMFSYIVYKQTAMYSITMALGAVCWLVGNVIWLAGEPIFMSSLWWAAFLILTIAGERLELARLMRHGRWSHYLFALIVGLLLLGLLITRRDYDLGWRWVGASQVAIALWLLRYDLVRRTIRQKALPRFIAACLGMGYIWLGVSGVLALGYGGVKAGLIYDAILHATFLGFAFSMIFGHAPIILPAVLEIQVQYAPRFYLHLSLLHLSVLLRVASDLHGWQDGRRWGGMLNAWVLLLFIGNMVWSFRNREDKPLIPQSRQAVAAYGFALPLFVIGFILVGFGLINGLQKSTPPVTSPQGEVVNQASIEQGRRLYQQNCASCHGFNLRGVPGIGKNLLDSPFVLGHSDSDLLAFIVAGRPSWHPDNTTGVEMPARGGNSFLGDADIEAIIAYIRTEASR